MPSTSYHWLLPTTTRSDEKIIGFSKLIPFFLTVHSIVIEKALCWRPSEEFSFSFDAQRFGIWFWYLEKYFNGDAQYCVGEVFHWRSTVLWWRRPSIDDQGKGIGVSEVKRYYGWEVFHVIVMMHRSEEAEYCGGEGPVLMTQRGTIGSGGGGAGRILPSLPLISSQLTPRHWYCPGQ